jgi:hypothetical protein
MEIKASKAAPPASDGALLRGSGRWSVMWALGMFAIFVGERMIGAGSTRTVATVLGLVLVIGAMAVRFMRAGKIGGRSAQAREHAAGAVRGRPGRRVAVRDPVGSLGLRLQATAGAQLAEALDGAVSAVAGHVGGGRMADPARRAGVRGDGARAAPELGRIRSACCPASAWPPR